MEGSSSGLRRGAWTVEEDSLLRQCIDTYGEGKWHQVPLRSGLNRCRKSCRLRWLNYLKPSIKRGRFNSDEVDLLIRLHKLLGNRWSLIAGRLPGRTANDVKNYWNTHLSKKSEPCCKTKMRKRNINTGFGSIVPAQITETPAQKIVVLKPRARSFVINKSCNNQPEHVEKFPQCHGPNIKNVSENNITCNKDEEKGEFVNTQVDGENMWWESLLDESQDADVTAAEKGIPFDVEKLWTLFEEESVDEL